MHLREITLQTEKYPVQDKYPFNLDLFRKTRGLVFNSNISFFVGENGSGKSTLLRAIASACGIHIWKDEERRRYKPNKYENDLSRYLQVGWMEGRVPGSFFASENFHEFAEMLDEWAINDKEQLKHFGGDSLLTRSHGQRHLTFFRNRYGLKGLYLLDEPENALSPRSQIDFISLLEEFSGSGQSQFIIATHSPLLISCRGAEIFSFDKAPVEKIDPQQTELHKIYQSFFNNRK